jgi:uncharacterized protein (DUF1697 family)
MATYVALLRAINVGGQKAVPMTDLRGLPEKLGFTNARTLLQSGNLVFSGAKQAVAEVERALAAEARKRLKLDTDFFVRTATEWTGLVAACPFRKEAATDPAHLLVLFLKKAPGDEEVDALRAAIAGRETVRAVGRQAYVVYPDGIGRSRLTVALIEKKLGARGTGRNWNTVLKLAALAGA